MVFPQMRAHDWTQPAIAGPFGHRPLFGCAGRRRSRLRWRPNFSRVTAHAPRRDNVSAFPTSCAAAARAIGRRFPPSGRANSSPLFRRGAGFRDQRTRLPSRMRASSQAKGAVRRKRICRLRIYLSSSATIEFSTSPPRRVARSLPPDKRTSPSPSSIASFPAFNGAPDIS